MKKINKIFVESHVFDQGGQGTASYLRNLYSTKILQNQNFIFYFAANNTEKLRSIFGNKTNVRYIKYPTSNKFLRLLFLIPFYELKYRFNYAHFQYYMPPINFCKTIVTIHDVLFMDYKQYFKKTYILKNFIFFGYSIKFANKLLTVSEYSKEKIKKHFSIKKEIFVIPNSIKENEIILTKQTENYILFVSRIEKRKNHINLCKAFLDSEIKNKCFLYIVGRKDEGSSDFFDYIKKLPIEESNRIRILENVSDEELKILYSNAKLFVFPSYCEGFGIPPLEAVSYNISTICAKNTGMLDFTFFGDRFFDADNINSIKLKLEKYYGNTNGLMKIKEEMLKKYSLDNINLLFSEYLNKLFL